MVKMSFLQIILYVLLSPILPWSIAVSLASVATEFTSLSSALFMAWCFGIFEDSSQIRPYGVTSFVLVSCVFVSWYLSTRYQTYARWWSLLIGTLGQLAIFALNQQPVRFSWLVGQWVMILAVIFIRRKFFDRDGVYVGI